MVNEMAASGRPFSLVVLAIRHTDAWCHTSTAHRAMRVAQTPYIKAPVKPWVESAVA